LVIDPDFYLHGKVFDHLSAADVLAAQARFSRRQLNQPGPLGGRHLFHADAPAKNSSLPRDDEKNVRLGPPHARFYRARRPFVEIGLTEIKGTSN
jgi:hypothetical protein